MVRKEPGKKYDSSFGEHMDINALSGSGPSAAGGAISHTHGKSSGHEHKINTASPAPNKGNELQDIVAGLPPEVLAAHMHKLGGTVC